MISTTWNKDTATVFALLLLIPALSFEHILTLIAFVLLLLAVTVPLVLYPLGWTWLTFSNVLRDIVQNVVFSVVYFFIITPVGMIRIFFNPSLREYWGFSPTQSTLRADDITNDTACSEAVKNPF
jgi:hypothetical protein